MNNKIFPIQHINKTEICKKCLFYIKENFHSLFKKKLIKNLLLKFNKNLTNFQILKIENAEKFLYCNFMELESKV